MAYLTYNLVPRVYSRDRAFFRSLVRGAHAQTLHVAVIGDSRSTDPGGQGKVYLPNLLYRFYGLYGNSPGTMFAGSSSFSTGTPDSAFMLAGLPDSTAAATRLAANQLVPGLASNAKAFVSGDARGLHLKLLPDATWIVNEDPHLQGFPIGSTLYMDTSVGVYADILAATNASSGGVKYQTKPQDAISTTISSSSAGTGFVSVDELSASVLENATLDVIKARVGPLDFNGLGAIQLQVIGDDAVKYTDVIAARFVTPNKPQGVTIDALAFGGAGANDWLTGHEDIGLTIAAMNPGLLWINLGVNDATATNPSAETFYTNLTNLIDTLRGWVGGNIPILVTAPPAVYDSLYDETEQAAFDTYAGVGYAIAQEDDRILFINTRRVLAEDDGWDTAPDLSTWLHDGVHFNGTGAQLVALREYTEIYNEVYNFGDGTMSYATTRDSLSPVATWRLGDSSSPLVDQVGAINLTVSNPPNAYNVTSLINGDSNGAIDTTGNAYAYATGLADTVLNSADVKSIEVWIRPSSVTGEQWLCLRRTSSVFTFYAVLLNGRNIEVVWSSVAGTRHQLATTNSPISIGGTYHIVVTNNAGTITIYVNGQPITSTGSATDQWPPAVGVMSLFSESNNTNPYLGIMDELSLYASVLTPTEVDELFALGTGTNEVGLPLLPPSGAAFQLINDLACQTIQVKG